MKETQSSFEILEPIDRDKILKLLELAGRNCYKSESRINETSAPDFIRMIIDHGTESVLEHEKITVRFICDRGVSHELVRHRLASYSQESTRYCNYGKGGGLTFITPYWAKHNPESYEIWRLAMETAEVAYMELLERGWTPQQARGVLPSSLKTDIVVTANIREWRTIFLQRCSKKAHPQMREIMLPLFEYLKGTLPELFGDIKF